MTSCECFECSLVCDGLHSNEAFALEGLGLVRVIAEQVAALAPVAGQEVQLAPASQEGRCIHVQVVVVLQQHARYHSKPRKSLYSINNSTAYPAFVALTVMQPCRCFLAKTCGWLDRKNGVCNLRAA